MFFRNAVTHAGEVRNRAGFAWTKAIAAHREHLVLRKSDLMVERSHTDGFTNAITLRTMLPSVFG